jgi:hypothetical protein
LALEATPVAKEQIVVRHVESAGCYGHNGADDAAFDAVLMALRCPGQPVRVMWSRADELTHSPFASAQRVMHVPPGGRKDFEIYIKEADVDRVVYVCTTSMLRAGQEDNAIISSRICSRLDGEKA